MPFGNFLEGWLPGKRLFLTQQPLKLATPPPPHIPPSDQSGQLVYEVVNSVDHELDVVLLFHAVLAMSPQDDIHVRTEDAFCHLHGDVPGDVLVFQPVDESHGTGDGDGTLEQTVIFCLTQKVHVKLVNTVLRVFGGHCPLPLLLKLLTYLQIPKRTNRSKKTSLKTKCFANFQTKQQNKYDVLYETILYIPTSRERELNVLTTWSAAVEMPTSATAFSGLAMAASSMIQPPILEPTSIYK